MYNTTNIPKATKRVNISGDTPPDIWMSMLDSYGKLQNSTSENYSYKALEKKLTQQDKNVK